MNPGFSLNRHHTMTMASNVVDAFLGGAVGLLLQNFLVFGNACIEFAKAAYLHEQHLAEIQFEIEATRGSLMGLRRLPYTAADIHVLFIRVHRMHAQLHDIQQICQWHGRWQAVQMYIRRGYADKEIINLQNQLEGLRTVVDRLFARETHGMVGKLHERILWMGRAMTVSEDDSNAVGFNLCSEYANAGASRLPFRRSLSCTKLGVGKTYSFGQINGHDELSFNKRLLFHRSWSHRMVGIANELEGSSSQQSTPSLTNHTDKLSFKPICTDNPLYGFIRRDVKALEYALIGRGQLAAVNPPPSHCGPEILCIHGMAGVGKTTLAIQIHDSEEMAREFSDGVFFASCGEHRLGGELMEVVRQKVGKYRTHAHGSAQEWHNSSIYSEVERECALKGDMRGKRILIVIDDVWRCDQIEWIDTVVPQSCSVVVTTRNLDTVTMPAMTHLVEPLPEGEAFKLFCHCAFRDEVPPAELEHEARKVCERCRGLPLALWVVGSNLYPRRQEREFWRSWLNFLLQVGSSSPSHRSHPGADESYRHVLKVIQKSITALADVKPDLCDMSLDLAGFPEDHKIERNLMETLWSIYPSVRSVEIARERMNTLIRLSLVEPHGSSCVCLHDLIRQAAIDMMQSDTVVPVILGQPSNCVGPLKCEAGPVQHERWFISSDELDSVQTIPYLGYYTYSKKLMWITSKSMRIWHILSLPSLPTMFPCLESFFWSWPEGFHSMVNDNNEGASKFSLCQQFLKKVAAKSHQLRIMVLLDVPSSCLVFPGFLSSFPNLQALWLHLFAHGNYCSSDSKAARLFSSSIGELQHLQVLVIHVADGSDGTLAIDPADIEKLTNLRVLRTTNVSYLTQEQQCEQRDGCKIPRKWPKRWPFIPLNFRSEIASSILQSTEDSERTDEGVLSKLLAPKLEELCIAIDSEPDANCNSEVRDRAVPSILGQLTGLHSVELHGFQLLQRVPDEIGYLAKLAKLVIDGSPLVALPSSIGCLSSLTWLEIRSSKLELIPDEIGNLKRLMHLAITSARLSTLPSTVQDLFHLTCFDFSWSLGCVSHIPEGLWESTNLRKLDLCHSGLDSLPAKIGELVLLEVVNLSFCKQLRSLPAEIGRLVKLHSLELASMSLTHLPDSISKLLNLTSLDVSNCSQLAELPSGISHLAKLCNLNVEHCRGL
ncbi:hypothetical protein CBR_g46415 [Chara braunii]|uniref:AAA+ ATPase domain-containing protein n=1 Tax=Chara braunii TaxID=69332 RepID=A0A388M0G7_CHABU|nr:hypothetical protein CBR_g46415 [Chara braunii]|eukprot:GBG88046.1 hypothetical protein CBR_g46415 [Chara braunii]